MTHANSRQPTSPSEPCQLNREAIAWICSAQGQESLRSFTANIPPTAKQILRARTEFGGQRGQEVISQFTLQTELCAKLGEPKSISTTWLGTKKGVQQSTDSLIAEYKASRFPQGVPVVDFCCGIGGDSIALARRGPVVAVDADRAVCRYVAHNLWAANVGSAMVVCERAERFIFSEPSKAWLHADPDRRPGDVRVSKVDYYSPSSSVVSALVRKYAGAAVKLAPVADIPADWQEPAEREWISRGGQCRQQVAWYFGNTQQSFGSEPHPFGSEMRVRLRRATIVSENSGYESVWAEESAISAAYVGDASEPKSFLYDFDSAVRAAGMTLWLAKSLGVQTLGGPAGFLTSEQSPEFGQQNERLRSRLVSAFEVLWHGAFDLGQIRDELDIRRCGTLEIKIRGVKLKGHPVTPESLRSKLLPGKARKQSPPESMSNAPPSSLTLLVGVLSSGRPFSAIARRIENLDRVS